MKILKSQEFINEKLQINPIDLDSVTDKGTPSFNSIPALSKIGIKMELLSGEADNVDNNIIEAFTQIGADILNRFNIIRIMKTGNIELIGQFLASTQLHNKLRFVICLHSNPLCVRKQYWTRQPFSSNYDWSAAGKLFSGVTIEQICDQFKKWVKKKLL